MLKTFYIIIIKIGTIQMQYAVDVCYGIQSGVKVESWIYKILLKQREYCFLKITWTAVDFHSDCYVPVPSHW